MNFLTYGNKNDLPVMFLHGMASTALACYEPILKYLSGCYVILGEVEGHYDGSAGLRSLPEECGEAEDYVLRELNGRLFCLSGFSMGGTMAVEIAGSGRIAIDRLHLDAAFLTKMGLLTKPYEVMFTASIARLLRGKSLPKPLVDFVMGKDNRSVLEMLYPGIAADTIRKVCETVYTYDIPENIRSFSGKAAFWYGGNELYPKKSAALLRQYLPGLSEEMIPGMGHGQYLHEHPGEYAKRLLAFLR